MPWNGLVTKAGLVLGMLALPAVTQAQDTPERRSLDRAAYAALVRVEQEPSYASLPGLVFGLPRENHKGERLRILYEAAIAPPFFLFAGRQPFLIAVTPKIVVRQYAGGSYPVPPPSYMPRITAYYWGAPFATRTHVDSAIYAFLRLGHHSNGQEGLFYDTTVTPRQVNIRDGDFFTNYLELGLVRRRFGRERVMGAQQASLEWHPEGWMAKAMRPIYGRYRAHVDTHLRFTDGGWGPLDGAIISVGYIGGSLAPERRTMRSRATVAATLTSNIGDLGDFQPFVGYYAGQDPYNIRFGRSVSVLKIGMMTAMPAEGASGGGAR